MAGPICVLSDLSATEVEFYMLPAVAPSAPPLQLGEIIQPDWIGHFVLKNILKLGIHGESKLISLNSKSNDSDIHP